MATLYTVFGKTFSWISQQQLPLGQKNVAVVERIKQESMYWISNKKRGRCGC